MLAILRQFKCSRFLRCIAEPAGKGPQGYMRAVVLDKLLGVFRGEIVKIFLLKPAYLNEYLPERFKFVGYDFLYLA